MAFKQEFEHSCSLHHNKIPDIQDATSRGIELQPRSYDATEINRALEAIVASPPSTRQLFDRYEFLSDYLLADIDNMSYGEMYDWVECLMVHVDKYFFRGGLTQGKERYLTLRLYEKMFPVAQGFCDEGIVPLHYRLFLFTADRQTGRRRSKVSLLTTLVHEMAHVYLSVFFNFCPVDRHGDRVTRDGGHGPLWKEVYTHIYMHMRTWDPKVLGGLNIEPEGFWPDQLVRAYYAVANKMPWFRKTWEVTDLDDDQPLLYPPLLWKIDGKESFRRAGLRLEAKSFDDFVAARVPVPAEFELLVCRAFFLASFVAMLGFLVLYVVLPEVFAYVVSWEWFSVLWHWPVRLSGYVFGKDFASGLVSGWWLRFSRFGEAVLWKILAWVWGHFVPLVVGLLLCRRTVGVMFTGLLRLWRRG